jgi:hypothetical protein
MVLGHVGRKTNDIKVAYTENTLTLISDLYQIFSVESAEMHPRISSDACLKACIIKRRLQNLSKLEGIVYGGI